jgi:uncharacterized membrane protein HdeD (DUF308 family)
MRNSLVTNWWALVLRGLLGIALGVVTFLWPGITFVALVFLFAGYALMDGVLSVIGAVRAMEAHDRWGVLVMEGVLGIATAAITVFWPAITALALVLVIAAWAIMTGILELVAAVRLRRLIRGEWLLALGGIASVAFGVLLAISPMIGGLVIAMWVGAYAFVFGALLLFLGFRLRSMGRTHITGAFVPAH